MMTARVTLMTARPSPASRAAQPQMTNNMPRLCTFRPDTHSPLCAAWVGSKHLTASATARVMTHLATSDGSRRLWWSIGGGGDASSSFSGRAGRTTGRAFWSNRSAPQTVEKKPGEDVPHVIEVEMRAADDGGARLAEDETAGGAAEGSDVPATDDGDDGDDVAVPSEPTRATLWWRAVKLPMYSVALAPLTAAAAMCHHWYGCVNVPQFGAFAAGACLVIAWLNLSNDAWDAETGVDANGEGGKPESVVRLLGGDEAAVTKVHGAALACLAVGAWALLKAAAVTAAAASGNLANVVGGMLALAVALGHAYQGPPFRLSYKGLGEPICFAAFGPLAVGAFYLALAAGTGGSVWMGLPAVPSLGQPGVMGAAALVGLTTSAILFTSHFHQEDGDRAAGKQSPVVRLGVPNAVKTLRGALAGHHAIAVGMAAVGALPVMGAVGVMLAAPLAAMIERYATANQSMPAKLFKTKYLAVRWHIAHALLLSLGCVADPWMPWHLAAARVPGLAIGVVY